MQRSHLISVIALMMGLVLSCVAGYFSVIGIATIFSGAFVSTLIMATALETTKVVAASWLYRNWSIAPLLLKVYMLIAVIVLIIITSMGIFGYLSKAHIEQTVSVGGNNEIRVEALERRIERQNAIVSDSEKVLAQLDASVEILQANDRIRGKSGAIQVRKDQAEERQSLNQTIEEAYQEIERLQEELIPLKQESLALETEVGPIKYISELIYGESENQLDNAVRMFTLILVSVFDPLAICMILAGNTGLAHRKKSVTITTPTEKTNSVSIDKGKVKDMYKDGHGLVE